MRYILPGMMLVIALTMSGVTARDEKLDHVIPLRRVDLEKLEGVWHLQADPKEGWKGTVSVSIRLYDAKGKSADYGYLQYAYNLVDGTKKAEGIGQPGLGIPFGGIQQRKKQWLVTSSKPTLEGGLPPFEREPTEGLSTPFTVAGDKLTMDLSKSLDRFVWGRPKQMKIDWTDSTWIKLKAPTLEDDLKSLDGKWTTAETTKIKVTLTLSSTKRVIDIRAIDSDRTMRFTLALGQTSGEVFQLIEEQGKRFIVCRESSAIPDSTPTRFEYRRNGDKLTLVIEAKGMNKGLSGEHILERVRK